MDTEKCGVLEDKLKKRERERESFSKKKGKNGSKCNRFAIID